MSMRDTKATVMVAAMAMAAAADACAQNQAASALPDVVGIRPGISAQEAYDLLKARAPGAKVGVGQFPVSGVSDKPVPVSMAVDIPDADPSEVIGVWLTIPPSRQVVWAIGRSIVFAQNKQVLKSKVLGGLRQKYGREADEQYQYWAFDEQGRRSENAGQKGANCINRANWSLPVAPPQAANFAYFTPLLTVPVPPNACTSLTEIRAELISPQNNEYVSQVTVVLSDLALARRSQDAYQAVLSNAEAARKKNEFEKARQQKTPVF
jgi:hypothetical protein